MSKRKTDWSWGVAALAFGIVAGGFGYLGFRSVRSDMIGVALNGPQMREQRDNHTYDAQLATAFNMALQQKRIVSLDEVLSANVSNINPSIQERKP